MKKIIRTLVVLALMLLLVVYVKPDFKVVTEWIQSMVTAAKDGANHMEQTIQGETETVEEPVVNTNYRTSYGKTYTLDDSTGISKAVSMLLEKGGKTLFGNYAIDEAFLNWVASKYGKAVICDMAYSVYEGHNESCLWEDYLGKSLGILFTEFCLDTRFATYGIENVVWMDDGTTIGATETTISLVGDINFDEDWYTMQQMSASGNQLSNVMGDDILSVLNASTITWINNEFTYGDEGEPLAGKDYVFRAGTDKTSLLEEMGCDIVSLGNNHVYDYGESGLLSTIDALNESGIEYTGAGTDLDDAMAPRYFIVNGKKIALVAATQIEITLNYTKQATANTAGVLKTLDSELFVREIKEAKANSDYVIVYVHWGWEGRLNADYSQRELANDFVKAGADMIIGSHAHRMQGVSYVNDVPVVWSLGNFWFSTGELYTTIAQVHVTDEGLSLSLVPCLQSNLTTTLITDEGTVNDFYHYVSDLSEQVAITADGYIEKNDGTRDERYRYYSAEHYRDHSADFDLSGNPIDGVGNLR